MAHNKTRKDLQVELVENYHLDTVGAPFKIVLKNCVSRTIDPGTGEEHIEYPDPVGLILAAVRCRVLDPRRMSGRDLSFVRKSLGIKANKIAEFLDMTPEHYSRCESGARALAAASEKQLRLFAFVASLFNDAEKLLDQRETSKPLPEPVSVKSQKKVEEFLKVFLAMKIEPQLRLVNEDEEEIEYVFSRCSLPSNDQRPECPDQEGDWQPLKTAS